MLFEEQPLLLVPLIVLTVEVWLRVRGPLFAASKKLLTRRPGTM
jgi:hypothetical protein